MIELQPLVDPVAQVRRLMQEGIDDYEYWEQTDMSRLKTVRASGLPFCPSSYLYRFGMFGTKGRIDARMMFYIKVGHVVHDWIQDVLGHTGAILGDWYNYKTQEYRKFSVHPEPGNHQWKYRELVLRTTKLVGHCDAVIVLDKKLARKASKAKTEEQRIARFVKYKVRLHVGDYKTCSLASVGAKARNPGKGYEEQLWAYARALQELKLNVSSWGNIFIPRDNPLKYEVAGNLWTPEISKTIKKNLKTYNLLLEQAQAATTWSDFKALLKVGPCSNAYCPVCKTPQPKVTLRQAFKRGVAENWWPASKIVNPTENP